MTPELARNLASYNALMNEKLYDCVAQLGDDDRKSDRGAYFRSIHGTLNHILLGDKLWMGRFTGDLFEVESLAQELHSEFGSLKGDRQSTDRAIAQYMAALTPEALSGKLRYESKLKQKTIEIDLWLAIAHFFNHQTHHRGQVTTLLSQMGLDIGDTDLVFLAPAVQGA